MKTSGGSEGLYITITADTWLLLDAAAGDGTVTSVSVVTANGVSGSVADPTTTPAITLTLGAITPTSVNKVTITQPATGATLTIPEGVTLNAGAGGTLGSNAFNSTAFVPQTTSVNGKALSGNITLGLASADFANQGTATTVLHGNAAGNPAFGAVVEADITLADNTTNNFSTTKHGFVPKGTNVGNFLKDDGTWAAAGGGAPGGSDTQVQFNDATAFGGDAGFTYSKTTDTLALGEETTSTGTLKLFSALDSGSVSLRADNPNGLDWVTTLPGATTKIPIISQTITVTGPTAARTWTVPDANFSAARIDAEQTFVGTQNFANGANIAVGNFEAAAGAAHAWVGRSRIVSPSNGVIKFLDNAETGIGKLLNGRVVTVKTADYSVLFDDSNTFFTNAGAGAGVIFTLPTPVIGMTYEFYRDANQTVTVDIGAGVTIRVGASVTTDGGNVTLDAVGSRIRLVAIGTTLWVGDVSGAATFN